MDRHRRRKTVPSELEALDEELQLAEQALVDRCRDWRQAPRARFTSVEVSVRGALDDVLFSEDGVIPLDYKSRGSIPDLGDSSEVSHYYRRQLTVYRLMLEASEYPTPAKPTGVLIFCAPVVGDGGRLGFRTEAVQLSLNTEAVKETIQDAARTLRGSMPEAGADCDRCQWVSKINGL